MTHIVWFIRVLSVFLNTFWRHCKIILDFFLIQIWNSTLEFWMLQTEMIFAFMTFDVVSLEFKKQLTSHFLHDSRLIKSNSKVKFIFISFRRSVINWTIEVGFHRLGRSALVVLGPILSAVDTVRCPILSAVDLPAWSAVRYWSLRSKNFRSAEWNPVEIQKFIQQKQIGFQSEWWNIVWRLD